MNGSLTLADLTERRETVYYRIAFVFSVILWLLCVVTISPIIIIGFVALFLWLGNGLLIAQLKADAVKVDGEQLPELSATFAKVCEKLQIPKVPALYILRSDGALNAFATRHCGRDFVVVYSELLDTYGAASPEIEFLLGHELGHIKRRHLLKQLFLAPALFLPLLGHAYSRACELSCDRHGLFAASESQGAINAMLVLAGGRQAKAAMVPAAVARQYTDDRGFFVSWYELVSGYPTTSRRLANLTALSEGREPTRAHRHWLAYVFAFFTFGGRGSGGSSIFITVAIIGLLAAIAIPSFVKARETAQRHACVNNLRILDAAKEQAALAHRYESGATIPEDQISEYLPSGFGGLRCHKGGSYSINAVGQDPECSVHGTMSGAIEEMGNRSSSRRLR